MRKKIVTIGGGTGNFTILSGLKKYEDFSLSAIVSMADDGGSTGRLRDELGVLPPGDVRQCLVALSKESQEVRDLFNYRFERGQLKGHTVGNIFLSALEKKQGSFSEGLEVAMKILDIKGEVIPVTDDNVSLCMELESGLRLRGEHEINHSHSIQKNGLAKIFLKPKAKLNPKAKEAIKKADIIVIGPGNHYCSIVPNLLVSDMRKSIQETKAKIVYVANLVNKKGHTDGFSLDDYVDSISDFIGEDQIDHVIYNSQSPSKQLKQKYQKRGEGVIEFNKSDRSSRSYSVIMANLLGKMTIYDKADVVAVANERSLIRHDHNRLAKIVKYISEMNEYKNVIKKIV